MAPGGSTRRHSTTTTRVIRGRTRLPSCTTTLGPWLWTSDRSPPCTADSAEEVPFDGSGQTLAPTLNARGTEPPSALSGGGRFVAWATSVGAHLGAFRGLRP